MTNATTALDLGSYRFRSAAGHVFTVQARGLGRAKRIAGETATFIGKAW